MKLLYGHFQQLEHGVISKKYDVNVSYYLIERQDVGRVLENVGGNQPQHQKKIDQSLVGKIVRANLFADGYVNREIHNVQFFCGFSERDVMIREKMSEINQQAELEAEHKTAIESKYAYKPVTWAELEESNVYLLHAKERYKVELDLIGDKIALLTVNYNPLAAAPKDSQVIWNEENQIELYGETYEAYQVKPYLRPRFY